MSEILFTDLTLSDPLLEALGEMGYERPTPVQASAIPMAAAGSDLMVQSQTGTGKTAAFGIPLIESIKPGKGIRGLVLCPTRELAKQVADELTLLGKFKQIRPAAVYGGASIEKQMAEMRFAQIVVGTPGRVLDHLRRKNISFKGVQCMVLDEADEMLSMGFAEELEQIMRYVPTDRQTLLFSATIPPDIKRYAKRYMQEPEFLSLIEENVAADEVTHHYYMVSGVGRSRDLIKVVNFEDPKSAIIFTNTRKDCEVVARALKRAGYDAEYLNSDLSQRERERVMNRMKNKDVRFLVATDIAARGIDISELSHVINFVLPESPEVYIHRTGRTGRAGAKGTAISLIGPREIGVYYYLKRIYNVALEEQTIPSDTEIDLRRAESKTKTLIDQINASVTGSADPSLKAQAARLLEREDALDLVQRLLHAFVNQTPKGTVPSVGGLLKDVPKPERVAPGGRANTIEGIASRVATIRGEYRGLPGGSKSTEGDDSSKSDSGSPSSSSIDIGTAKTESKSDDKSDKASAKKTKRQDSAPASKEEKITTPAKETPKKSRSTSRRAAKKSTPIDTAAEVKASKTGGVKGRLKQRVRDSLARKTSAPPAPLPVEPSPSENISEQNESEREVAASPSKPKRTVKAPSEPVNLPNEGDVRLFINLGHRDRIDEEGLVDAIAELAGLLPEDFLAVDLRPRHSYLTLPAEFAGDLIEAVDGERVGRRRLRVEPARTEDDS